MRYKAETVPRLTGDTGHVVTVEIDADLTTAAWRPPQTCGQVEAVCADGGRGSNGSARTQQSAADRGPAWNPVRAARHRALAHVRTRRCAHPDGPTPGLRRDCRRDERYRARVSDCACLPIRYRRFADAVRGPDPRIIERAVLGHPPSNARSCAIDRHLDAALEFDVDECFRQRVPDTGSRTAPPSTSASDPTADACRYSRPRQTDPGIDTPPGRLP